MATPLCMEMPSYMMPGIGNFNAHNLLCAGTMTTDWNQDVENTSTSTLQFSLWHQLGHWPFSEQPWHSPINPLESAWCVVLTTSRSSCRYPGYFPFTRLTGKFSPVQQLLGSPQYGNFNVVQNFNHSYCSCSRDYNPLFFSLLLHGRAQCSVIARDSWGLWKL